MSSRAEQILADGAAPGVRRSKFRDKQSEILMAAGRLFNRHGLRDTTLALISAEIGLNLKSLRYYFERKEDIVASAFLHSIELHRQLVREASQEATPEGRLRRFITAYIGLRASVRRSDVPEFVHFGDIRALTEPHFSRVGEPFVAMFREVRALLGGHWQGERREINARTHFLLSQMFWSVIWLQNWVIDDFDEAASAFADILVNGVANRSMDYDVNLAAVAAAVQPEGAGLSQDSFLRAATDLINDQGYRGASVDRISALLNVTKGAFYHYNATRDDLVVACFERTFEAVKAAQSAALLAGASGAATLCDVASSLVTRQTLAEGVLLRTSALTALGPDLRREMELRMACLTHRFQDMLNTGLADSSIRPVNLRIAAEMVTAMVNSAQELHRWAAPLPPEHAAALFVKPMMAGLLAPPARLSR